MAVILVTDEAAQAVKNKLPTDTRLIKIMNGYDEDTLPTTVEARQLAAVLLQARGHIFAKDKK